LPEKAMSNMRVFFKKIKVLDRFSSRKPAMVGAERFYLFYLPESGFIFVISVLFVAGKTRRHRAAETGFI